MQNELEQLSVHHCFGGRVVFCSHFSLACQTVMRFAVYVPPSAAHHQCPMLFYLAGLTCTEETFFAKGGAQRLAAEYGLILVSPDTSPRNTGIAGEDADWDFGTGAGFYVDAIQQPWSRHYQMYSYVTDELPAIVAANFNGERARQGIFGHSMGGHGALLCGLRNPGQYRSVSALAPISAPMQCPWGLKAFSGYLGDDQTLWRSYDASECVKHNQLPFTIRIDQGLADKFLDPQLKPALFEQACADAGQPLALYRHQGYDHSYYFVSTFMADHIAYHAKLLSK